MESLKDILLEKNLDEPSDITALRNYYMQKFKTKPDIAITKNNIVLKVPNGKIASEIRGSILEIQRRCQLTKKLFIKIG